MKSKKVRAATAATAMAVSVLSSPAAHSAHDMFIKIGAIQGEAQDKTYKDWIDVLSWSWGMTQSGRAEDGLCVDDLEIVKSIDLATPELIVSGAFGDFIPRARLAVVSDQAGGRQEFLVIDMKAVLITSYSTSGISDEDRPLEKVRLSFEEAQGTYTQFDETGRPVGKKSFNVRSTRECKLSTGDRAKAAKRPPG